MGWGDEILAAGQAQRIWDSAPGVPIAIHDGAGHARWHPIWEGNPILVRPSDVIGSGCRTITNGPNCRPYIVPPFTKESGWTFNANFKCREHIAKLYLTLEEQRKGAWALAEHGPYVLIEPYTKHANFRWSLDRWHQLVAACPDLTFVQHVHKDSALVRGAFAELATFREACGLIAAADVYVRSESGLCHAAAALGCRQVTLFGGCMDPQVMGFYPGQTVIADTGDGSPCGRWLPCAHCDACMARITVEQVIVALRAQLRERRAA